ncbi:hypothetical protein TNCV_181541 [Trichonephila clavipes]|nr:hypothetical protein TNCV_181541 [Trichonephila clavipes]
MNLKPTCPSMARDIMASIREPIPVEAWDVVFVKVVTQKCVGGPPVDRDRLNAILDLERRQIERTLLYGEGVHAFRT